MVRFLAALNLIIIFSLYSMEKPTQFVRVFTANQSQHWDVDKVVVDQCGVLADQMQDGNSSPFIPVNLEAKQFENILKLPEVSKVRKECLRQCNTEYVAEIAIAADCLAAHSVLKQTLSILCQRPFVKSKILPESLQQALIAKAIRKNHYLKTVLLKEREINASPLKDTDRMHDHRVSREKIIEPTNALTFDCYDTKTKKRRAVECVSGLEVRLDHYPLHGYNVDYDLASERAVYYLYRNSTNYLVLCDLQKTLFLQKWPMLTDLTSQVIHKRGIVAIAKGSGNVLFANIDSPEWKVYKPFKSTHPTSLTINSTRTKVVVGSHYGQIAVWDLNERDKPPVILNCSELAVAPSCESRIEALVFNPKKDLMLAIAASFSQICLMSLETQKDELIGFHGRVESLLFNNSGDLLISAGSKTKIRIWSVLLKQKLHTMDCSKVNLMCTVARLSFSADNRLLMLASTHSHSVIKLVNEETSKSIEFLPLAVVDFLIGIGRQLAEKEKKNGLHEEQNEFLNLPYDCKPLYAQLPPQLKALIKKNVSWNDWIWL